MDTRNIKDAPVANTKISKILSGGGIIWERERPYRIDWYITINRTFSVENIKKNYKTSYKIKDGKFIAYGDIETIKLGEEYYGINSVSKCIIKIFMGDKYSVEFCQGEIIYED